LPSSRCIGGESVSPESRGAEKTMERRTAGFVEKDPRAHIFENLAQRKKDEVRGGVRQAKGSREAGRMGKTPVVDVGKKGTRKP